MSKAYKIKLLNNKIATLIDSKRLKVLISENYNYSFRKSDGFFVRCGKTKEDDGDLNLGLPEIADIEISTVCDGVNGVCKFCYKSNTPNGKYMSFETFKLLFSKLPKSITQIALGIGNLSFEGTETMFQIIDYCRENGVIPNLTINGAGIDDDNIAIRLSRSLGACAVSVYDKEVTYNAVKKLTDLGMTQVNIHFMISEETFDLANHLIEDRLNDIRLKNLNAIVFLSLKQKGRGEKYHQLSNEKFKQIIDRCIELNINFGMDSCSSFKFLRNVDNREKYEMSVESCEAGIYSSYINTEGEYFPCSFMEGKDDWSEGLDILNCEDFLKDIWWNEKTLKFKEKIINCRKCEICCPLYEI